MSIWHIHSTLITESCRRAGLWGFGVLRRSMVLDLELFRADKGGNPDKIKENQSKRYKDVTLVDKVVENDTQWRKSKFCFLFDKWTADYFILMPANSVLHYISSIIFILWLSLIIHWFLIYLERNVNKLMMQSCGRYIEWQVTSL